MKTFIVFLFIGVGFLLPNHQSEKALPDTTGVCVDAPDLPININAGVTFGRLRKNCQGLGVCSVWVSTSNDRRGSTATLVVTQNRIRWWRIKKSTVSKEDQEKYFKDGTFVVEEDFNTELKHNGEIYKISLKAGKYKIEETKTEFNIGMPPT
ncbi:MAG: hypothetical protein R2824_14030 [Saprospiraceae bacterium]